MSARQFQQGHSGDEIAVGIVLALLVHGGAAGPAVYRWARHGHAADGDQAPLVAKPVIAATLLKLGKPLDPSKLPERIVPRAKTAPKAEVKASQEDPKKKATDAGAPPQAVAEGDLRNAPSNDPFAEDAGRDRPQEGHAAGIDGGTEVDPAKVKAGDMYAALLGAFLAERMTYPTTISLGEASRLCAVFQVNISPRMAVWYLRNEPIKKSGNDLYDDAARNMLQKLLDDHVALPEPPSPVADQFKGKRVNIAILGDPRGDPARCK